MPKYIIDGDPYFFKDNLTQEEAEERVSKRKSGVITNKEGQAAGTYKDPKYEGFFTEAGEGVVSGAIGIVHQIFF